MLGSNPVEPFRRINDQCLDRPQWNLGLQANVRWNRREGLVDALHTLDVDLQAIEKNARKRVAGDLGERWVAFDALPVQVLILATGADNHHLFRPQVNGRRNGR